MKERRYLILLLALVGACAPEIGSPEWCEAMDERPKGEWTTNDMGEYARNCIFRKGKGGD